MPDKNIHKGHRQRMKHKFLLNGLDDFEQHQALELLLYYAVPRCDTNPMAHRLLEHFGSISAIFDAPVDALKESGISETTATLLKIVPEFSRLYLDDKYNNKNKIINFDNLIEYFSNKFVGRNEETVMLLLADAKGKEIFSGVIAKGSLNSSDVPIRKVVDLSLRYNAKTAVIAHNHPSGVAIPSIADINTTKDIYDALDHINVLLADHIIIADGDGISIAQSQLGEGIFYSCEE
ncbi:MAG: hypothetical protein J1E56_00980 [Ruminococcus sp.]|nr:hypothetical protein [Ruminococcus sp.]